MMIFHTCKRAENSVYKKFDFGGHIRFFQKIEAIIFGQNLNFFCNDFF